MLSRVALIDATGAIGAVAGTSSDCVHVDGSTGACGSGGGGGGGSGPTFVDGETPSGSMNGSNTTFTLANTPSPSASVMLWRGGLFQKQGFDYTIAGAVISFYPAATPQTDDVLVASYRR